MNMKTISKKIILLSLIVFCILNAYAQNINKRIKQSELPYTIPIVEQPSGSDNFQYRWLENNQAIPNATALEYTIPQNKEVGKYTYINQIKCGNCSDWLSSNLFTVEIYNVPNRLKSAASSFSVGFSPQKELTGYLEELVTLIDQTQQTLDICIYSIDSYDVYLALKRAVARSVQVRMLYEGAAEDKNQTGVTVSYKLEEIGVDVKYVNKINHHKFIVSDNSKMITASANWNSDANWVNDENYVSLADAEILLRYRAEFELLWNNSREFGNARVYSVVTPASLLSAITDNADIDAFFTSSNYRTYISETYGPTFAKITGKQDVSARIVALINQAQTTIKMSANHLRSRPICQALMQKKIQNPAIDIKIYTDQQEYITESYNTYQTTRQQACVSSATTETQKNECLEENFMYSYNLISASIDMRFKCYSYKWDNTTAEMMHNKYAIFDDSIVATGSYNYSYNSETNSLENVLIFNRSISDVSVDRYISNFNLLWERGRTENYYTDLLSYLSSTSRFVPLVFPTVSLTQTEYANVKSTVESVCPTVKNSYFSNNGQFYDSYLKGIGLTYGNNNSVVSKITDNVNNEFTYDYTYNTLNYLNGTSFQSNDNLSYSEINTYNANNNLSNASTPLENVTFAYSDNYDIESVNNGQGLHTWSYESLPDSAVRITYNAPYRNGYIVSEWNNEYLPTKLTDLSNRTIQWNYDTNNELSAVVAPNRTINFTNHSNQFTANTTDGEGYNLTLNSLTNFSINTTGTVAASIDYNTQLLADKKQNQSILLTSNNVASGTGKTATINYTFDAYDKVVNAGNMSIARKAFSGEVTSITNGNIVETRQYNDWGLQTQKMVKYSGTIIYQADYLYDGMQRIKQLTENVAGVSTIYTYIYNARSQLETVTKDGVVSEQYAYDNYGNRTTVNLSNVNYSYSNNNINQTNKYSWTISGTTKHREFSFNNAGQLTGTVNKTGNAVTSSKNFSYNIFGNLNAVSWASQNLEFKYDAFDRQIATYLNGAVKRKLIYGIDNLPIAELNENDRIINTFVYADQNTPILMRKGSVDYYIVSDIRGSVKMVVKATDGNVMQKMEYDAFGKVLSDDNPGYTPFGYAGGLYEYRTDLVRFGARDYLAETGKWSAEDPIGFLSGSFNNYTYVSNDPVNYADPSGLAENPCGNIESSDKGFNSHPSLTRALGPAGKDQSWHHIVNQNESNIQKFGPQTIHNTNNIIRLPNDIHSKISSYYARIKEDISGKMRI